MPYGVPLTDEERKQRHLAKYGTLENFPEVRRGMGLGMSEDCSDKIILGGIFGAIIGYILGRK